MQQQGKIYLDTQWQIINEYKGLANEGGQPGIGDRFLKWLLINRNNFQYCQQIQITPISAYDFKEFPNDPALETFDRSDRKFVAVALAAPDRPTIYNAVDSDWAEYYPALVKHGIKVEFLCPDVVTPAYLP